MDAVIPARGGPAGVAVFGAVVLHLLVALGLAGSAGVQVGEGGRDTEVALSDRPLIRSLQVRSLQALPGPAVVSPAPVGEDSSGAKAPATPVAAAVSQASAPESEEALMARLTREAAEAAAAREAIAGASFDDYLSAAGLTRRPQIQDGVQLPWPVGQDVPDGELYMGRFRLFIDEQGRVRRILGEGGNLLPPLVRLTQEKFQQARFAPGELEGRPVKSWIRIEVTFDARGVASTRLLN